MKFDVFVSFRGTDTRRTFVSHLCHVLDRRRRLKTFKHEEDISENQPASSQVLQAIEESKVAIAIISENYASSIWCLDELEKIIECKEEGSLQVILVFYEVDYPDVLRQAKELANDLIQETGNLGKVQRWLDALKKLSTILSHNSLKWSEDSKMIENIVDDVFRHWFAPQPSIDHNEDMSGDMSGDMRRTHIKELRTTDLINMTIHDAINAIRTLAERYMFGDNSVRVEPRSRSSVYGEKYITGNELSRLIPSVSSDYNSLVGMDSHMKAIDSLLNLELSDGVREIGIWGAVGVGKTTIARFVYDRISPHFQDHYYHSSGKYCPHRNSTCLLENITRDVIGGHNLAMNHNVVKAKLGHQKVLLIVDGLHFQRELERIITIARLFGRGSRLIVVGKDKDLLTNGGVGHLYEVEGMRYDVALQLFSLFAFKQEYVPRGFDRLAPRAVFIAGHLPLAIKVLGSFLHGKDVKEWELELHKLEASQDKWIFAVVSSYIGGDSNQRRSTILDQCIGEEDEGDEFPLYCFALR